MKKKILQLKTFLLAHKALISVAVLASVLFVAIIYQYADYHIFKTNKNIEVALEKKQRVVVDLNDKVLPNKNLDEASDKVEHDGEVPFSADKTAPAIAESSSSESDDAHPQPTAATPAAEDPSKKITAISRPIEIAIVIVNLGLSEEALAQIATMPKNFTLAFSPYGQLSTKSSIALAEEGFQILAELPMDSSAKSADAGRFGISILNDDFKNKQNLEAISSILPSAVGVLTPSEEDFSDQAKFDTVLKLIKDKDLGLIYYGSAAKRIKEYAAINGLETAYPDLTIDEQATPENIEAQLRALEMLAEENGFAVGLARPYPISLDALVAWEKTLEQKKIVLIPVISR
jgi:polysaccharide deacetylase 2 family uncharacterized protein YibQ